MSDGLTWDPSFQAFLVALGQPPPLQGCTLSQLVRKWQSWGTAERMAVVREAEAGGQVVTLRDLHRLELDSLRQLQVGGERRYRQDMAGTSVGLRPLLWSET